MKKEEKKRLMKLAGLLSESSNDDSGYQKMMDDHLIRIKTASTVDELEKETMYERFGGMMGFNPAEPFRTAYRLKTEELLLKEGWSNDEIQKLKWWNSSSQGEFIPTKSDLPPNALY